MRRGIIFGELPLGSRSILESTRLAVVESERNAHEDPPSLQIQHVEQVSTYHFIAVDVPVLDESKLDVAMYLFRHTTMNGRVKKSMIKMPTTSIGRKRATADATPDPTYLLSYHERCARRILRIKPDAR